MSLSTLKHVTTTRILILDKDNGNQDRWFRSLKLHARTYGQVCFLLKKYNLHRKLSATDLSVVGPLGSPLKKPAFTSPTKPMASSSSSQSEEPETPSRGRATRPSPPAGSG